MEWVVKDIAARGALTHLYGDAGIGKSYLSLAFIKGVTENIPIADFPCRQGRALLVDAENGPNELSRRLHSLSFNGQCGTDFQVIEPEPGSSISDRPNMIYLMQSILVLGPRLVVLDSVRSLWGGNENDSLEVTNFCVQLQQLAREHDTAIILLHHSNKDGVYAGSRAWTTVPEIVCKMGKHPLDKNSQRLFIRWTKSRMGPMPDQQWAEIVQSPTFGVTVESTHPPKKNELWEV